MIEYYAQIKLLHISTALASGSLFASRAVGANLGGRWPLAAPARFLSYSIDTALLASAFLLMAITHQFPLVQSWLTVKVLLVILYIALGTLALKRGRTRPIRIACGVCAVATFLLIVTIARAHSPWGPLAGMIG